jgi:signal transduction histidine kinase/DNA-binding LacI/PurR family transcriptional regulator/AraC-like DNA-binding protein/CheY-like chemotaxis protein
MAAPGRHGPKRARAPNGFKTVGLLLADIHTGASVSLWPGVSEEAARNGVNLVCFPGGRLRAEQEFEAGRNSVYDLAGPESLEGLVTWASSLGGSLGPEEIDAFHARYRRIPMVSLALPVAGAPAVTLDAYLGMREVISHLIEVHGHTRIAFIRGPSAHPSAEKRYRAYADTLADHGLPLVDSLVTSPLRWDEGEEAVRILLDRRRLKPGVDFQAVAAASDLLALWALKALQARGYRVPADFAVTGFNDTAESRLATPPLTTAVMPFREQGARAMDTLAALMAGQEVPAVVSLPTALVVRQSCGCPSSALTLAVSVPAEPTESGCRIGELSSKLTAQRGECLEEMAVLSGVGENGKTAWLVPLLDALIKDIEGISPARFLVTLDGVLDRAIRADVEIPPWQGAISALRRRVFRLLAPTDRPTVEDLFAQARVLIDEATGRERTYRQWQADLLSRSLREIGGSLLMTFDLDRLVDAMAENIPSLGIESVYLALYERPEESTEYSRLVLARTDRGRADLPGDGLRFPTRLLIPREYLPRTRRYEFVVEPLYFRERQFGFAVFEVGPRNGAVYEELRGYVSSALKGAFLLGEARDARVAAEKADLIKTRLLANVSHELRAPLAIILQRTQGQLDDGEAAGKSGALPPDLVQDLKLIKGNAEHQLSLINDLLDLSRAEIDELDLSLEPLDPRSILEEVFRDFSTRQKTGKAVKVRLEAPDRLPVIRADPVRLRQILLNLMGNAVKFTKRGSVTLAAEVSPPFLHISVSDTGPGIPEEMRSRIFEPFVTAAHGETHSGGIGLGLSIARHLTSLHFGELSLETEVGKGSVFHVNLPLPDLSGRSIQERQDAEPVLILISRTQEAPPEISEFCRRNGLSIRALDVDGDWEAALAGVRPAALAWDLADADQREHMIVRKLRHHPQLFQAPLVLYGAIPSGTAIGLTGFVAKPASERTLIDLIDASCPVGAKGPVLVVDDDSAERSAEQALAGLALPGVRVLAAADGAEALRVMEEEVPCLVLLDFAMPLMTGAEVLDRMRMNPRLRQVPVIVLTNKVLDDADVRRLEAHARVVMQSKGIWSDAEAVSALGRSLLDSEGLPPHTGALVKRAVAWLARNHRKNVTRWKLAEAVNASEDYLARVFHRELGISPWEYLARYRVSKAKDLLSTTSESVKAIASMVGFKDQAYFSRVFRKITGVSPQAYRQGQ